MQDVMYAWRVIVRRPRVSALVVTTLAIGMAATTIVFSLADAILWHPLPFRDADRLVRVRIGVAGAGAASARPLDAPGSPLSALRLLLGAVAPRRPTCCAWSSGPARAWSPPA